MKYSGREAEGIHFRTRLRLSRKLRICYVLWTPQTPTNYVLRSFLVLLPLRVRSTSQLLEISSLPKIGLYSIYMSIPEISLNTMPVRNVPSILYTNPPVHSLQPTNNEAIPSKNTPSASSPEPSSFSDTNRLTEKFQPISTTTNQVSFFSTNDNEYIAMASGIPVSANDKRFQMPDNKRLVNSTNRVPRLPKKHLKDVNDYIFQMYVGSLSVIGLFMLFRFIQKS